MAKMSLKKDTTEIKKVKRQLKKKKNQPMNSNLFVEPKAEPCCDHLAVLKYTIFPKLVERQLILKRIAQEENSINIANVPSLLDLDTISAMVAHVAKAEPKETEILKTTAANGDLEQGHRILKMSFESPSIVTELLKKVNDFGVLCAADFGRPKLRGVYSELCEQYRDLFKPTEEMQKGVEEYVSQYDKQIAEERRLARLGHTQPDEEGWITVTKASRKKARAIKLKAGENTIIGSLKNQSKKKEPAVPFYSFQIKQSKLEKMEELQAKFEDDKKRIANAKANRKFNPT
ncbi:unnamed protein product, partial [Mesorhabditis belari]|uniref:Ribosomal RNA-processing protein 7 C-terminal domain-containing protein n=1 Tax=Mesorhabditis belari TaxID=2138241 RepID=A0AAF3ESF5_9BILA